MKAWRKLFVLLLVLLLISLAGCDFMPLSQEAYQQYEADRQLLYVAFSAGEEDGDPFDYTTIADYQSEFSPYNCRVLYNTLNTAEQQVYRLFEYALDHGYTNLFIDDGLLAETELPLKDILEFFCMDSPFAEQNYNYQWGENAYTFSYLDGKYSFEVTGIEMEINSFSQDKLKKKKEALEEAKRVIQSAPQGTSDLETARWIYRYLTEEVTYYASGQESQNTHYLYDALCQKQTECDGFANTFSLLCHLSGIPCFEKIYSPETEGTTGHTWNCFQADGVWYNADCALSDELIAEQARLGIDFCFAFSDQRQEYPQDQAQRLPACTTDLVPTDCVVPSPTVPEMIPEIRAAFDRTSQNYVLVCFDEGTLTDSALQNIVYELRCGLHSLRFTWGGKSYYFLFKQ